MARPDTLTKAGCSILALLLGLGIDPGFVGSSPGDRSSFLVGSAHADDDDDDDYGDDDDDDDDDRPRRAVRERVIERPTRARPAAPARQRPARVAAPPAPVVPPLPDAAPGEIVGLDIDDTQIAALEASGFTVLERESLDRFGTNVTRLQVPAALTIDAAQGAILAVAPAATIDRNHLYTPEQSGLQAPAAPCLSGDCLAREIIAWAPATGSTACSGAIRVGMIDTAINREHPVLAGADLEVIRLGEAELPPSGRQHGTAVASLFVGSAESRSPGLLPGASLIAVDTFSARSGQDASDAFSIARGLDYLVGREVTVINLSLSGPANAVLERAVRAALESDTILVAAAGNEGPAAAPVYPAGYDHVIAVTAVDRDKRPYRRAGRGEHVDLAAPGVEVWTAASIEGARTKTGTSFAAPFVSAAAALLRVRTPDIEGPEVVAALTQGAEDLGDPGKDAIFGWGLVSAGGLCAAAGAPSEEIAAPTTVSQ